MTFIPRVALVFDSVGLGEWVVWFVVILVVVGPKRLPGIARKIGRMSEVFRRAADEFRRQLLTMDQEPVKTPESSSTDADGVPKYDDGTTEDPYSSLPEDSLSGESPYPGNEDQWSSTQLSDIPPEADDAAAETSAESGAAGDVPIVDRAVEESAMAESSRGAAEPAPTPATPEAKA